MVQELEQRPPSFDREMQADIAEEMSRKSDVFVFGRVTYEIVAAYWPSAVPYEDGDELNPAEGRRTPGSFGPSTTSPSWCSPRR
jgi:dihydrofolate reductase